MFTPVRACLLAASAAAAFAVPPQAAPAPAPADLARAIQQKYDTVRDFSASFEHRYRGGVLRKEAVERGTMQVKKPSRMRWTYESPERKVFVADGTRIYSYIPEDRQVIVAPVPAGSRGHDTGAVPVGPRQPHAGFRGVVPAGARSRARARTPSSWSPTAGKPSTTG